jgi:hypothetical protein
MIHNMGLRLSDVTGAYREAFPDTMAYSTIEDLLSISKHPDYTYLSGWSFWDRMILVAHMGNTVARNYDLDQVWSHNSGEDVPLPLRKPLLDLLSLDGYDGN